MSKFMRYADLIGDKLLILIKDFKKYCSNIVEKANNGIIAFKEQSNTNLDKENKTKRIAGLAVIGIGVLLCLSLIFSMLGTRSVNAVIEDYINVMFNVDFDASGITKIFPDEMINFYVDGLKASDTSLSKKEIIENFELEINASAKETLLQYMEDYGYGWTYKFKIIDKFECPDSYIQEYFEEWNLSVSNKYNNATNVGVEISIIKDGEIIDTDILYVTVAKKGAKWYLLP